MQGVLKLAAGVFMVIMGINMMGIFPWLRKLNPRLPKIFAQRINREKGQSKSPLIVGLLNGFMPCGPLQAMQIYALSTGNPFTGALSMFMFSMGTVPLMFGLGAVSSVIGKKFTGKVMTAGAVLVVVLGLSMLSQGWSLSGFTSSTLAATPGSGSVTQNEPGIVIEDGYQIINSTLSGGRYPAITVQAGTPVKWYIDAPQGSINGCNNRFFINEYGIEHTFKYGENVIEFMPDTAGTFRYSCWMGMIRSTITVTEAELLAESPVAASEPESPPTYNSTEESSPPFAFDSDLSSEPIPANVVIPTDTLAVAELTVENDFEYQTVTIRLTDEGYSPAVVVVQAGLDTEWIIDNASSRDENYSLLVPAYYTEILLNAYENPLYLFPTESFDFSNGDNSSYGYIKVVDDLNMIDLDQIRAEAGSYPTMIWPRDIFQSGNQSSGGASCH
jgi:plastocyanin domain-containing protein